MKETRDDVVVEESSSSSSNTSSDKTEEMAEDVWLSSSLSLLLITSGFVFSHSGNSSMMTNSSSPSSDPILLGIGGSSLMRPLLSGDGVRKTLNRACRSTRIVMVIVYICFLSVLCVRGGAKNNEGPSELSLPVFSLGVCVVCVCVPCLVCFFLRLD